MDGFSDSALALDGRDADRVAVIDIGSNSVRLVVYDGCTRASRSIFNEKTACALGSDIGADGRLSERGLQCVTAAMERFVRVAHALDVRVVDAFATAAAREAQNRQELIDRVLAVSGLNVEILSGEEEGRLSAEGVLASMPGVDGAMGDLGGGSLELVELDGGQVGACSTMPLGLLRLAASHGSNLAAIRKVIRKSLTGLDWVPAIRGRSFVAVGGAWRALARVYMNVTAAPIHIVQGLSVDARPLRTFLARVAKGGHQDEKAVRGLSRRRVEMMPVAATLLLEVIDRGGPATVMFSAYGVREGRLMSHLPLHERSRDPLLAACTEISADTPRFRLGVDEVFRWMSPLFVDEAPGHERMRNAACLVGDIGWREHPDYRPEQVFRRLLLMPAVGIDHVGRAYLASAVYARYTQHFETPVLAPARSLLSDAEFQDATVAGGALRLAYEMSGGDGALLSQTRLERDRETLTLHMSADVAPIVGNAADRRLAQLAKRAGLKPAMRIEP